jgi:diguanylate cyclase (GGDEF)-like protein
MTNRSRYALLGALAGLCVPLGAWALRVAPHLGAWPAEWARYRFFYEYMGAAAAASLAFCGRLVGAQYDTLQDERCSCRSTREILNRLALTDGLTGLHNRRSLDEHLAQELKEADRYGNALTCLMLDIDNFKRLNDAYGHSFGDVVLTGLGRLIAETIRRADIAGRYGGEEFLIVMPRLAATAALASAERLRAAVAREPFLYEGKPVGVTVSIGVADLRSLPPERRGQRALIEAADRALYDVKRTGKNRCALWAPSLQRRS